MDHCGFQVRDMDKAIRFYTEKLSFALDFRTINQEEQAITLLDIANKLLTSINIAQLYAAVAWRELTQTS